MNKRQLIISAVGFWLAALCVFTQASGAASYSSKALIENSKLLDGKRVVYRGEAVTAIMKRGAYAWVNVNDGENAIGIWCGDSMLEGVKFLGGYKYKGDMLEVDGIFNRACPSHGGELDIHANKIKVIKAGFPVRERMDLRKVALAAFLFLVIIAVTITFRKRI